MAKFIARHSVAHGRNEDNSPRVYEAGEEMELDPIKDAKTIEQLRKVSAIALPNELEAPEDVAAREQRLRDENDALRAEVEALRASKNAEKPAKPAK